jgi:hypothetical protein
MPRPSRYAICPVETGAAPGPAYRRRWCAKLKWYRAQKVLPAEEGGGEMGTLIATTEENGIDSIAIEQQLRELLAL